MDLDSHETGAATRSAVERAWPYPSPIYRCKQESESIMQRTAPHRAVVIYFVLLLPLTVLVCCRMPSAAQFDSQASEHVSKVAPELLRLYEEYSSYIASGKRGVFESSSPLVQIIDDRVMIDAVASGDANVLKSDLEALGMQQAVAFGRVVSGQLPILAIGSASSLRNLTSARATSAVLQPPQSSAPGTDR